jgi:hypothetical protein
MRRELVEALSQLRAGPSQMLHATLVSPRPYGDRTDTENVLLFNLSSGRALSPSCARGLRFERLEARPASPELPDAEHQHIYELADLEDGFCHHELGQPIAGFDWIEVPKWSDINGAYPSQIWWQVRRATKLTTSGSGVPPTACGLRLELKANRSHAGSVIKKAIDAVIAAHQAHPGALDPRLPAVLERQIGVPGEEVQALLRDPSTAALGVAPLVHPRGQSLQWSPVDDLLVAFEIRLEQVPIRAPWQMRGSLYTVETGLPASSTD